MEKQEKKNRRESKTEKPKERKENELGTKINEQKKKEV
jgi:hypothetical protein